VFVAPDVFLKYHGLAVVLDPLKEKVSIICMRKSTFKIKKTAKMAVSIIIYFYNLIFFDVYF